MDAGKLRHRITFQGPMGSRDAVGERVTTWTDEASVWAEIRPLTAREQFIAAQQQASTTHFVSVRYRVLLAALIVASWRIKFHQRIFTIDGLPKNIDERNIELQFACTEGLSVE
jgi:SPP1 family predicted phage head-tail adaptor